MTGAANVSAPLVQLGRLACVSSDNPDLRAAARAQFARDAYLKLPAFVEPSLLAQLLDELDRTEFYHRVHDGIGTEQCAVSGHVSGTLELLANDAHLRHVVADVTGCGTVGCFEGRVYRLSPGTDHHDSWHSDVGEDRLVAMSINLSRERADGGLLQIRRADSTALLGEVSNPIAGDAVIFRIDPSLRHRVGGVTGHVSRTAYAGWFRRTPSFEDLWRRHREP
jgi:hypothetical protein